MKKKKTPMKKSGKPKFTLEQLDKAFNHLDDLLDRMLCSYMLAGNTLKTMREGQIDGDKIEVIVLERHYGNEARSIFSSPELRQLIRMEDIEEEDGFLRWKFGGVPIEVKIVKRHYGCLQRPDVIFYKYAQFKVPNPWQTYWKIKGLIR